MNRLANLFAVAGALALAAGLALEPQRTWANLLLVSYYLLGLGLAGVFFIALQYATGSGWSVALRRVPEAMTSALPAGALGIAAVLIAGSSVYPWAGEHLEGFKGAWLSRPFFVARAAVYVLLWLAFAAAIVRASRRQDADGDLRHTRGNARRSALFLVVFAVTVWLASYDWIMSLEPEFASTIFGVYNFAGLFLGGLAALILLVVRCEKEGALRGFLTPEHLHDLGKLLFAFSTFWMYIWFSQYMLIWYANIPEEAGYFVRRTHGPWQPLFLLDMALNWWVPFLVLLPKRTKRSAATLSKVAAVVLVGRWLDLYLMILPPLAGAKPVFGLPEAGLALGGFGLFMIVFRRGFAKAPAVPARDPLLVESLHYHS